MRTKSAWRRGAGVAAVTAVVAVVVATVLLTTAAGGSNGSYAVRAIFDNAGNLTSGENVEVDEVKVGSVGEIAVTPQGKAAVSLHIANPGFKDFRADASCTIIPQSLLGEKYVNCAPTQPRPEGAPLPPPLKAIPSGREGAGERLLPLSNTHSPVGVDQLQDITREPEAQSLRILLNELGVTFAGRGSELHEVIVRANPGLRELNKVLHILAGQSHLLADLAVEGDRALAPLAAERRSVQGFVQHGNTVAQASARHLDALKQDLAKLPSFLRNLGPAMERFGRFAEQTTPTATDLGIAAPSIDEAFENLAPFSKSSTAYFKSLGKTAEATGPALQATKPLLNRLQPLGKAVKPFAGNLSALLGSLRSTGGLERLMDFIFMATGGTNGYDALGHFLRAEVIAAPCVNYVLEAAAGCSTKFVGGAPSASASSSGMSSAAGVPDKGGPASGASAARSAASRDAMSIVMLRTLAVLKGMTPEQAIEKYPGAEGESSGGGASSPFAAQSKPVGGASSGTTYYSPGAESPQISAQLLEYLLGS